MAAIRRRETILPLLGFLLSGPSLQSCGSFTKSYLVRFRLTLHAVLDGADFNASSVIQSQWMDTGPLSQQGRWRAQYVGEAPLLDFGKERALIALLGSMIGYSQRFPADPAMFHRIFPQNPESKSEDEYWEHLSQSTQERDLPRQYWPLFAYFPVVKDLTSARILTPDNLRDVSGVQIERISIGLTQDRVTETLDAHLPWIDQIGKTMVPATTSPTSLPAYEQFEPRNFHATAGVI